MIARFTGDFSFLSNFHVSPFREEGIVYPSVEHYFQAAKVLSRQHRVVIAEATTARVAKQMGRSAFLRPDWDEVKLGVMRRGLELKFAPATDLAVRLVCTAPHVLIEGNTWGDTYWGQVNGYGLNWLGHLLMARRGELGA